MTKEWNRWEETIKTIYKGQGKTLEETMQIMKDEYNFIASIRAYRSRLKRWGCVKYNKNPNQRGGNARATLTPTTPSDSGLINESTTNLPRRVSFQRQLPLPPPPPPSSAVNAPYPSPETPSVQYPLDYSSDLGNPLSATPPNQYGDQQNYCSPVAYSGPQNPYLEMERQLSKQSSQNGLRHHHHRQQLMLAAGTASSLSASSTSAETMDQRFSMYGGLIPQANDERSPTIYNPQAQRHW
ncbi:Clr5 domain-domain-containing protein [Coniella lustricola]|uniref:Clr5 domain-domain-containing protein n=1 Tax=Coniella lustricola TaxID=2025994 RepID=A0A2T3ALZ8_9PEZI|nr:Clr5 domain-domain-containing protein [Coniella lustricola]